MSLEIDPRILYCLVLPDDDPYKTSPFQGFSPGWTELTWAMLRIVELPADIFEPALPSQSVRARRIGGTGGWHWFPLSQRALLDLEIPRNTPFWVIFSGTPNVASAVSSWAESQIVRPLHVTPVPSQGTISADKLNTTKIGEHIDATLKLLQQRDSALDCTELTSVRSEWRDKVHIDSVFPRRAHNCTLPNHMVLEAAGFRFKDVVPLIGQSMEPYTTAIRETVESVRTLRQDVGYVPGFRLTPPHPALILTSPALYRHAYWSAQMFSQEKTEEHESVNSVIQFFQRQKTFHWNLDQKQHQRLLASREARDVIRIRQQELEVYTLAVGLRAASTLAATIRVPPAVNRTAGVVRRMATYDRNAETFDSQRFVRLFATVQKALEDAVGSELLELISETEGGIKLVTDAPLEWLPIKGLPLGLRYDCSRVTAIPGNLMVGELVLPNSLHFHADDFTNVLVISAFDATDPIRYLIQGALNTGEQMWRDRLTIRTTEVHHEGEFCDALNAYDGNILVFDGHGRHDEGTEGATLSIGDSDVDVWSLRGKARIPPVVVLSACDTQAADRSHATTANAFLAAGARAVLGTLLPIEAGRAAVFIGRMLYRLADFFPATIGVRGEAIQWSEFVSGMLRMQLLTDLLRPYLENGLLNPEEYDNIHFRGNVEINLRRSDWFDVVTYLTSEHTELQLNHVQNDFRSRIPVSDTVRYVHMGNPETILVDDSSTMDRVRGDLERSNSTHA